MSRIAYLVLAAAVFALLGSGAGASVRAASHDSPVVTHGVVVGDVTASTAVLWARGDREGTLKVHLSGGKHDGVARLDVHAADDYTGQVVLSRLRPDTTYRYRVGSERGSFQTAPAADDAEPVSLAFGGDVAGQNVCRDASEGFPIMETIRAGRPDVFVGLGDMIYADNACNPVGLYGNAQVPGPGPAADLETFRAHWRYNRADAASQRLLRSTSYVGIWDDHEVVNDFGPLSDTRSTPPYTPGVHLLPIGLEAFLDYTPIAIAPNTPKRLYRSLRWGKHMELFVLDTRQYRDANIATDSPDRPKTMLGREQLTWLKESLAASDATWKVIVSSVPMSIPTGFPAAGGRDGWANFDQTTGFEEELLDILRFLDARGIVNTVWITTDVHFAEAFRYRPFPASPDFVVHELATGPMNAGIFPNAAFDTTLNPEVLFGPDPAAQVTTWEQAKDGFNFGTLEVDRRGRLTAEIVNTAGVTQFSLALTPR
ncbi:MAG TPA: alkaline phosphatase D family protein [Gaiellaceae bacterium]|nr:alkaline phosphatase D family protein [Gaiellaceae bacterium]